MLVSILIVAQLYRISFSYSDIVLSISSVAIGTSNLVIIFLYERILNQLERIKKKIRKKELVNINTHYIFNKHIGFNHYEVVIIKMFSFITSATLIFLFVVISVDLEKNFSTTIAISALILSLILLNLVFRFISLKNLFNSILPTNSDEDEVIKLLKEFEKQIEKHLKEQC